MRLLRTTAWVFATLAPATLLFAAQGKFDRTLTVNGPARLDISTGSGYIHITPGPAGVIHIEGYAHSSWSLFGSPESRVRNVIEHPPIEQNGNDIEIGRLRHSLNVAINYVVTAPQGTVTEANTGSGNINVSNLDAPLHAGTGSGNIFANDLTGDIVLHTGSGDIDAMMNGADHLRANTGSGDIRLDGVTGGLRAGTGSGNVEVDGRPEDGWRITTGSGGITLDTGSSGMMLDASTGSGGIDSSPPVTTHGTGNRHHVTGTINGGGPIVYARTGSGNIRIR